MAGTSVIKDKKSRIAGKAIILSAILFICCLILWVISYRTINWTIFKGNDRSRENHYIIFKLRAGCLIWEDTEKAGFEINGDYLEVTGFHIGNKFNTFTIWMPIVTSSAVTGLVWEVMIPLWIPSVIFSIIPAYRVYLWFLKRKRSRRYQCLLCGYDLFNLIKAICPECGTEFDPELLKNLHIEEPSEKKPT